MQTLKANTGLLMYFPVQLNGSEYIAVRAHLYEGLNKPDDIVIGDYQRRITNLLPVLCKYAEGSDEKPVEVNMALYDQVSPAEVDDIMAVMQDLWMNAREPKKKSTKNLKGS